MTANVDEGTVRSFGEEWSRFDQTALDDEELGRTFSEYFAIFPWDRIPAGARGADIGCGTGRFARLVARRVEELHLVDASEEALSIARRNLSELPNVVFHHGSVDSLPFADGSLDFAYSLGVLHHVPDTGAAIADCARKLKRGAPILLYVYYAFDNRPTWYRALWRISNALRRVIAVLPSRVRDAACDALAGLLYWPLARGAKLLSRWNLDVSGLPLAVYRDRSFYSMRTDSRDRFGTPLEKRFRADELSEMMWAAGLVDVRISPSPPFWCAVGFKA